MKQYTITEEDFLLANCRASRMEEIERHGKQITFRSHKQKSLRAYDRNKMKRMPLTDC